MANSAVIFLHISKTGGTTLRSIIQNQYAPEKIYDLDPSYFTSDSIDYDRVFVESFTHLTSMPDFKKQQFQCFFNPRAFGLHRFLPQPARYLTMMRDPIDQAISTYYFAVNKPKHVHHQIIKDKKLDMMGYFEHIGVDNLQTRRISGCDPFDSPADKQVALTTEIFDLACENLRNGIAIVGLLEEFDASILMMKKAFGWNDVRYVAHNVAPKRKSLEDVSPTVKAKLEDVLHYDIQLYRIAQEIFEEQRVQMGTDFSSSVSKYQQANQRFKKWKARKAQARNLLTNIKPW